MSDGGKGDKRVPETTPGNYRRGYDGIDWSGSPVPLICTACNTEPCDCQGTDDGPGQGSDEVKTNYERRNFEGDL